MNPATIREEIALRAARLIAEDGLDYGSAKRKAARDALGTSLGQSRIPSNWLPDNAAIEEEVRQYQELFQAETQPQRLRGLRLTALRLMQWLSAGLTNCHPHLVGAIVNGTASEHSDIHLQLFVDSVKEVEIFLLNQQIDFVAQEAAQTSRRSKNGAMAMEVLSFMWRSREMPHEEGVHLSLYETDAMRKSSKSSQSGGDDRLDQAGLERLLQASP